MQSIKNKLLFNTHYVLNSVIPLQTVSQFKENGTITPEEFVKACDLLILKCPNWSWSSGKQSLLKSYLPSDKQFIIIKSVPCHQKYGMDNNHMFVKSVNDLSIISFINTENKQQLQENKKQENKKLDLSSFEEDLQRDDISTALETALDIVSNRTYDITITYDNYYRCSRVWLYGYSDTIRRPLTSDEIFEDISKEYVNTTVTYEVHPHLDLYWVSIHPCKHANTMKTMIDRLNNVRVDQYMFVFLKFIQTVIPFIEYDWSSSI